MAADTKRKLCEQAERQRGACAKKKSKHNCINPMLGGFNPQPLSSVHEFIHRLWQEYWSYEIKALVTGQLV